MSRDSRLHEQHSRSDPGYIDERKAHRTREPGALDENRVPRARQGAHCLDGDERTRPVGVTLGRFRVEKRQDAAARLGPLFRLLTASQVDEVFGSDTGLLDSVPGIGKATTRVVIAELREPGTRGRRQIAALAGVAPFNHDSGKKAGRRAIADGRPGVRAALYMATYGDFGREPLQSCDRYPLPETPRRRENRQAGPDRLHAQAPRHSQWYAA
jgi:transposase